MTEIKHPLHLENETTPLDRVVDYKEKYGRQTLYALAVLLVLVLGYIGYKYVVQEPNETKATEAMFRAEYYYRADSTRLALNGDNLNAGFLKIISKYSGTKAAHLAAFYAGSCYIKMGDFKNAVKYLKDFSTPALQVQSRADGLLGDAYSELGEKDQAIEAYKKAGTVFDKDDILSSEYIFRAGYLYESMNKPKEAVEMYQLIKDKYPGSQRGLDIDKYLARLGTVK